MGELVDNEMPVYAVDKYSRYGDFILMFVKTYICRIIFYTFQKLLLNFYAFRSQFYATVKKRVKEHFESLNIVSIHVVYWPHCVLHILFYRIQNLTLKCSWYIFSFAVPRSSLGMAW